MTDGSPYRIAAPGFSREGISALGIVVLVVLVLSVLCAEIVREFFPYAEEWKILLPSLPQFAQPLEWFSGFAQTMEDPYPAWAFNSINFFRPVMNAAYWLRGELFGSDWGLYLYFNFLTLGLAAGALYLCLRLQRDQTTGEPLGVSVWLGAALVAAYLCMPALVSQASRLLPLILPQMAFDRLLAALCLLACLGYLYRRYRLATLFLVAALLTKEQAIPIAIALPLVYAWTHRRDWRSAWPTLLMLAFPLVAWFTLRLTLFGSISQGVYVLMRPPQEIVQEFVTNLIKLPLYVGPLSVVLKQPFSLQGFIALCNGMLLTYLAIDTLARWRARGPELISVAFIGVWCFLALVGLNPRYGATLAALSILMVARPAAPGLPQILRSIALVAMLLGGSVHGWLTYQSFSVHTEFSKIVYQAGSNYAEALQQAGDDTKLVVVLNDPNTMYTAPSDLAKVMGLPVTDVVKASDYPWPWPSPTARDLPDQDCEVIIDQVGVGRVQMIQSCGLATMGALMPDQQSLVLPLAEGVDVEFPEAGVSDIPGYRPLGRRMVVNIRRPGVKLLYFDPQAMNFHWLTPTLDSTTPLRETQ